MQTDEDSAMWQMQRVGSLGGGRSPKETPTASTGEVGKRFGPLQPLVHISSLECLPLSLSCVLLKHSSFRKPSQTMVFPVLLFLGNSCSPCASIMEQRVCHFIVSVFGARDPSAQLDCIPSKARPQSHIPQRSQHLCGPTQCWFTLIFMMRWSRGSLCAAPGLNC